MANQVKLVFTAAEKINIFDIKPTVGGIPNNEITLTARTKEVRGDFFLRPANPESSKVPIDLDTPIINKNAVKLVKA